MHPLGALGEAGAIGHQQRNGRGDPARHNGIAQKVVQPVQKAIEHGHRQGDFNGYPSRTVIREMAAKSKALINRP